MFVTVELLCRTWGRNERKENDRESTIPKCIPSVQVEDIMIYTESC
jgi:hypothetical protein